jgi:hypothetical protein
MRAAADHEFAQRRNRRATDQRVQGQDVEGGDDLADALPGKLDRVLCQMVDDPVEVVGDLRCQLDTGHRQRPTLRATGRCVALQARRASRWARISAHGIVLPEATIPA